MVVDASVLVSHLVPSEGRHEASRRWIARHIDGGGRSCCASRRYGF